MSGKAVLPRLLDELPWRVRLRLWITRRVDLIACWLILHGRPREAEWLWRACGMWKP